MTQRSLLQIPFGVQCFFGRAAHSRRAVERRVAEVFAGWSYEEIFLPLFDHFEVFARGGRSIDSQDIYRFIGRDGEVLALRPDFTALVAKFVASRMQERPLPLRLFYSGEILRYRPPEAGRHEDLFQIGLEHIGDGPAADLEVLLIVIEALDRLGVEEAVLTVGHAGFVHGLLQEAGISGSGEMRHDVLEAMRARDLDRIQQVLGTQVPATLGQALELSGGPEVIDNAQSIAKSPETRRALAHLETLSSELEKLGERHRVQFDLGEVLGFDYYTGMVFEIHTPGLGLPLGRGGRYDSLIGKFGLDRPAVGFSLSLDRLGKALSTASPDWAEIETPQPVRLGETLSSALSESVELRKKGRKVKLG